MASKKELRRRIKNLLATCHVLLAGTSPACGCDGAQCKALRAIRKTVAAKGKKP